jgi:thiol:disulfide interchange protein DsbD
VFLLMLALSAWLWGQFVQRGSAGRAWAALVAVALVAVGYAAVLEGQLQWRTPPAPAHGGRMARQSGGIRWEDWSPPAVAEARAAGRPVLVDFTADWCFTCQVNKKSSIEIAAVAQKIDATSTVALLADYTLRDDQITRELQRFGRAGVPLVLVYPRSQDQPPIVLPEVLTPTLVLDALEQAAR